ncbi:LOW QUALITY PROTEIN: hypothetical protein ElyMa_000692300, partial [Elysia marginata]
MSSPGCFMSGYWRSAF